MQTNSRVSLVIPVYNEVDQIHACLEAVARQTVRPFEVIVVDNNSTDGTAAIARAFPFVTVLHESRQGVVYARDRGFNAARGDIIARIDADTIINDNWIQSVVERFANSRVDVITGSVAVRDISAPRLIGRIDLFWRRYLAKRLGSWVGQQGANMALRRRVWTKVRLQLCHSTGLHEDFDLGIHAYQNGFIGFFDEAMRASISPRQSDASFGQFADYALTSPRTYLVHGAKQGRVMYRVVAFVILLYPIIYLMYKGYDSQTGRFSLAKLMSSSLAPRVNPATFID